MFIILLLVGHILVCYEMRGKDLICSFKRQYNLPFIIYFVQIMCSHSLETIGISLYVTYNTNHCFWITYISVVYVYKCLWCICNVINYFLNGHYLTIELESNNVHVYVQHKWWHHTFKGCQTYTWLCDRHLIKSRDFSTLIML